MKVGLQIQLSHQLKMTPQLQQAIKLLQLSTLDLQQEIQEALDSNPMLELIENQPTSAEQGDADGEKESSLESSESLQQVELNETNTIPDELPIDVAWEDVYQPSFTSSQARSEALSDEFKFDSVDTTSLFEHLLWQLKDRKSTRLNSSHLVISYAVFCLKKKKK